MASMDRDEAAALAHLVTVQTGLEAWTEQMDQTHWSVAVRENVKDHRFSDPALYRVWYDARQQAAMESAGIRSPKQHVFLHALAWLLGGFVGLLTEAISSMSNIDRAQDDAAARVNHAILEQQEQDFGYRLTHPPSTRR